MDKNRVEGAAQKGQGKAKEALGALTGDAKLKADGRKDRAAGGLKNAVGGAKDALRGKT
jgi:uncharacterized protein YjbJ (UPF0337 family)